jgi:iron complex outermembrane receptor protein
MSSTVKALPLAVTQLVASGVFCALAMAPTIAQPGPTSERIEAPAIAQPGPRSDRIEVTGSRIPRANTQTPSPVLTITEGDASKAGYTTVSGVLRDTPQVRLVRR